MQLLPPVAYEDCPASSFATKFVHVSTNKVRCSINKVLVSKKYKQFNEVRMCILKLRWTSAVQHNIVIHASSLSVVFDKKRKYIKRFLLGDSIWENIKTYGKVCINTWTIWLFHVSMLYENESIRLAGMVAIAINIQVYFACFSFEFVLS